MAERMPENLAEVGVWLTLEQLSRMAAVSPSWIEERVSAGLIDVVIEGADAGPARWRFDALVLRRVRSMRHTERCYGAGPELAALVADLEDEIAALRAHRARWRR